MGLKYALPPPLIRAALQNLRTAEAAMIIASNWRPLLKSRVHGFLTPILDPSGIELGECSLHEKGGKRWIGLPSRPQNKRDGSPKLDPKTGKAAWQPLVVIEEKEVRDRFQRAAIDTVDRLLTRGSAP
jgi:hypothetical protein